MLAASSLISLVQLATNAPKSAQEQHVQTKSTTDADGPNLPAQFKPRPCLAVRDERMLDNMHPTASRSCCKLPPLG